MKKRGLIIILFILTAIVIAWVIVGIGKENSNPKIEEEQSSMKKRIEKVQRFDPNQSINKGIEGELSFTLVETEDSTDSTKKFTYSVINEGTHNQKLSFTTSQRYEYELSSKEHGFIKRYSDGMNFLQVLKDITLSPQEELNYTISFQSLDKGNYSLTVYLAASGMNESSKTLLFTIE